ncbi:hypothetical protein LOK49_LG03G00535 [Camellia lanceoleosa]|uniref:Uncharacterized protein n=1 Tax=Camellia lanceoleosa TaxID=1840588 RepID=A0ACC0IB55_9ERIC|nr:hypothetical protein LOK49_LG03G00535 [Camellia lanceoleosa]
MVVLVAGGGGRASGGAGASLRCGSLLSCHDINLWFGVEFRWWCLWFSSVPHHASSTSLLQLQGASVLKLARSTNHSPDVGIAEWFRMPIENGDSVIAGYDDQSDNEDDGDKSQELRFRWE